MEKVDRWKCLTCKYGYTENRYTVYCDYLIMTGKRRNCPYGMCDKYEDGRQNKECRRKNKLELLDYCNGNMTESEDIL